jgi:protein AATF/BFR2
MLISGAGAVKGNLRALNQSVSSQVALLMKDPTKLARRSSVSAQQRPRVLCQLAQVLAEPLVDGVSKAASGRSQQKDVAEQHELDSDAFDDGEFYAQLLKEFLDSNSSGSLAVSGEYPQV